MYHQIFSLVQKESFLRETKTHLSRPTKSVTSTSYALYFLSPCLQDRGILPESVVNFTSLLGWHPKTTQTLFTLDELRSSFSLSDVNKSEACVDENFLLWLNKQYHTQLCADKERMEEFVKQLRESLMEKLKLVQYLMLTLLMLGTQLTSRRLSIAIYT